MIRLWFLNDVDSYGKKKAGQKKANPKPGQNKKQVNPQSAQFLLNLRKAFLQYSQKFGTYFTHCLRFINYTELQDLAEFSRVELRFKKYLSPKIMQFLLLSMLINDKVDILQFLHENCGYSLETLLIVKINLQGRDA